MIEEPPHVKQLSPNPVCKIELKTLQRLKQEWQEIPALFGEIERKLAYLSLPFFLLIILWYLPTVGWKVHCGIVGVQLNAVGCFLSAAAQQWRPVSCTAVQLTATTVAVVPQWRPVCCTAVQLAVATVAVVSQLRSWSRPSLYSSPYVSFSDFDFRKNKSTKKLRKLQVNFYTYFPYSRENKFLMFLTDSKHSSILPNSKHTCTKNYDITHSTHILKKPKFGEVS
jgi:hypothetical protein